MKLNKGTYTTIQKALRNRAEKIPLSALWRTLHGEVGVGVIVGRTLRLSQDDREKLRAWCKAESGADPMMVDVGGDRLAVAALVHNEKWAGEKVFAGMIQVSVRSGTIPLRVGEGATPPGTLLQVNAEDLDLSGLNDVILVENGTVARYWHQCRLPAELEGALMVYRGHATPAVKRWWDGLPSSIRRIGYFDFDPAGFGLALDYRVDATLIPATLDDGLIAGLGHDAESHHQQRAQRPEMRRQLPAGVRPVWDWMTEDGRGCAITQEHLHVSKTALRLLNWATVRPE